jgi:hypothetical protein
MTTLRDSLTWRSRATLSHDVGEGTVRQPWKGFVRF